MTETKPELVTLTIDEQEVTVPAGTLILDAAAALNIEIPIFCSHPKLDPVACCRMCFVEVTGPRGPQLMTACSVPVSQDMVVNTQTEQVKATQEANLAFILMNHPLDCPICDKGGECPLQDQTMRFGPGISLLVEPKRHKKKHYDISNTIVLDQERCIICWRCIRYLQEWEDKPQLGLFERGGETRIDIQQGRPVDAKTSGNIIDICPVGALTDEVARFAYRPWQIERTPSVCNHCSVGCNIRLDTRTHRLRRIVGRENPQVNDQWICDKGRFAHTWVNDAERLTMPLLRKDGELTPVSWSDAIDYVVEKLQSITSQYGPDAVGGIGSAKLSNEANYLLQRFMRQIIGTNNVDHRDGAAVAALPTGLPNLAGLMKPQYGPDPQYDCVMLFDVDPSEELPILDLHLKRSVRRGGMKLVIAHPRILELTRYDGAYLSHQPGAEVELLKRLSSVIAGSNAGTSKEATDDVDDAELEEAGEILKNAKNPLIIYGPMAARGANGQRVLTALQELASSIAAAGGPDAALAYVGLEANSQGCRDMGLLPNVLPGYAALEDETALARLASLWGAKPPTGVGRGYDSMLNSAGDDVKALLIMGANPASERSAWVEKLSKLDLLVVNELYLTETAQLADVVLPAVSWAESDGTFTNLERRVQRAPKTLENQHTKAAPDWLILDHIASRMGVNWPFADVQGITEEITKAIPIYGEMEWDALGDQGLQWDASMAPTATAIEAPSPKEAPSLTESPTTTRAFALIGGTVVYDGGTMFYRTEQMRDRVYYGVYLNPGDAENLGIEDGHMVQIISDAATITLPAHPNEQVLPGRVWIPESQLGVRMRDLYGNSTTASVDIRLLQTTEQQPSVASTETA